jgi:hypothetical protein
VKNISKTSINGKVIVTMNAQNQFVNTAILFALALTSELNSSDVNSHGIAPFLSIRMKFVVFVF